jgi:hypothetical protein
MSKQKKNESSIFFSQECKKKGKKEEKTVESQANAWPCRFSGLGSRA